MERSESACAVERSLPMTCSCSPETVRAVRFNNHDATRGAASQEPHPVAKKRDKDEAPDLTLWSDRELGSYEIYDLWRHISRRRDLEDGAVRYWLQGNRLPGGVSRLLVQDDGIGTI